jgi:hypothetical protein
MPFREAALRVPGRVPLGVPRARTRARRNRIRIKRLRFLAFRFRKQRRTCGTQVGGDTQHWRGSRMGRGYRSHFVLWAAVSRAGAKNLEAGQIGGRLGINAA